MGCMLLLVIRKSIDSPTYTFTGSFAAYLTCCPRYAIANSSCQAVRGQGLPSSCSSPRNECRAGMQPTSRCDSGHGRDPLEPGCCLHHTLMLCSGGPCLFASKAMHALGLQNSGCVALSPRPSQGRGVASSVMRHLPWHDATVRATVAWTARSQKCDSDGYMQLSKLSGIVLEIV